MGNSRHCRDLAASFVRRNKFINWMRTGQVQRCHRLYPLNYSNLKSALGPGEEVLHTRRGYSDQYNMLHPSRPIAKCLRHRTKLTPEMPNPLAED